MRLLVLGGTAWLGRTIATDAANRGHEVTCLARGDSGEVGPGLELIRADRDRADAYEGVVTGRWDAVVDVARQPGHLRRAVAALEPVAERYLFVSSANVYADQRIFDEDESAALLEPLGADVMESMADYGEAKVACEHAVLDGFGPGRSLLVRPGLIGGPGDPSGRSGYWPRRFATPSNPAGAVLVPEAPGPPTSLIDARDLAGWLVTCAAAGTAGVFNAGANRMPLAEHLGVARAIAGHTGPLVNRSSQWLTEHGVANWSGPKSLPLWLDDPEWYGMNTRNSSRARAAGLRCRPLEETLADALAAELSGPPPGERGAGLTDEQERALLTAAGALR